LSSGDALEKENQGIDGIAESIEEEQLQQGSLAHALDGKARRADFGLVGRPSDFIYGIIHEV
jgi:hypothetical protein